MRARQAASAPRTPHASFMCEVCAKDACYGLGWPLSPVDRWFCPAHRPADYWGTFR